MARHSEQMAMVVNRLLAKTKEGSISWTRSAQRGQFLTRIDDFLVQISGVRSGNFLSGLLVGQLGLRIANLDGDLIDNISSQPFPNPDKVEPISKELTEKLQELFDLVAEESEDLSRLLKAIG